MRLIFSSLRTENPNISVTSRSILIPSIVLGLAGWLPAQTEAVQQFLNEAVTSSAPGTRAQVTDYASASQRIDSLYDARSYHQLLIRRNWTPGDTGTASSYNKGDVVYYDGMTYVSLVNANKSSPVDGDWDPMPVQNHSELSAAQEVTAVSAESRVAATEEVRRVARGSWLRHLTGDSKPAPEVSPAPIAAKVELSALPSVEEASTGDSGALAVPVEKNRRPAGWFSGKALALKRGLLRLSAKLTQEPAYTFDGQEKSPALQASAATGPSKTATPPQDTPGASPVVLGPMAQFLAEEQGAAAAQQPAPSKRPRMHRILSALRRFSEMNERPESPSVDREAPSLYQQSSQK